MDVRAAEDQHMCDEVKLNQAAPLFSPFHEKSKQLVEKAISRQIS